MTRSHVTLPLDHVGLVGPDIEAMIAAYAALGFTVTPRQELMGRDSSGQLLPLGQQSAHVMFRETYIELTAFAPRPDHHLMPYAQRYDGIHILALASDDAQASHRQLAETGIAPQPVAEAARDVVYGKTGQAQFRWFAVAPDDFPEGLVCVGDQAPPDLVFPASAMAPTNKARAIPSLYVSAEDKADTATRYGKLAAALETAGAPCALQSGDAAWRRRFALPEAIAPAPGLLGIGIRVSDLAALRAALAASDATLLTDSADEIVIAPHHACGALLRFHE